jgi:glycosyltransferase involved in cell wall biosynthesis
MNKVLFVGPTKHGGAETQLLLLAKNLPEGWYPVVFSLTSGPLHKRFTEAGIEVRVVERKFRFDAFRPVIELRKYINKIKPSVVHSWDWMSAIASSVALVGKQIPHVAGVIRRGTLPKERRVFVKYSARLGNIAVANSQAGLTAWGLSPDRGRVVYNGFDWDRIHAYRNNKESDRQGGFNVTMIASFSDKKDWKSFIDTAKLLSQRKCGHDIFFQGWGDGPMRNDLLTYGKRLIKNGSLILPGKSNTPIKACMESNVGILLSTQGEGISNSIMEFMACGRPVICTRSSGNRELVIDGETGFFVDPDNPPEQIAEKIVWLRNNPEKAETMGKAGENRIRTHFSTEKMVDGFIKIYKSLID